MIFNDNNDESPQMTSVLVGKHVDDDNNLHLQFTLPDVGLAAEIVVAPEGAQLLPGFMNTALPFLVETVMSDLLDDDDDDDDTGATSPTLWLTNNKENPDE